MIQPLLKVQNLRIELTTRDGIAPVIDDLSFDLGAGESISFVGESGCGKSMTALGIMGLLPEKIGRIASGSISFNGEDLTTVSQKRLRAIRGNDISMIFQEPMTSLNPVYTVGEQIAEVLRAHQGLSKAAAWNSAIELLDAVRIPNAKRRVSDYPFQMSGGQRQRVMIAMALACKPKILIADEPTTALDVTVQAQIFDLLNDLKRQTGTAIILITHDMGVVAENADRVLVMYAGRKVEEADVDELFDNPGHPYTKGLLGSIPNLEEVAYVDGERARLNEISGMVPSLTDLPDGCAFAPRCSFAIDKCQTTYPPLEEVRPGHWISCWRASETD